MKEGLYLSEESLNTKHRKVVKYTGSFLEKSDGSPSRPEDVPDCTDEIAADVSKQVIGASRPGY